MKKILASALLAGLLLGTTSPVFAATTITETENAPTSHTVPISSVVETEYSVSIPETLSISLNEDTATTITDNIALVNLTTAGSVKVVADVAPMISSADSTDTIAIQISSDDETTYAGSTTFNLSEDELLFPLNKNISIKTDEVTKDHTSGTYTSLVTFNFTYEPTVGLN